MAEEHKFIKEQLQSLYEDDLGGLVDDVIGRLKSYKDKYSTYEDLEIEIDTSYDWDDSQHTTFTLIGYRKETDKEREKRLERSRKRIKSEKVRKARELMELETKEKSELERLSKKYGYKLEKE